MRPLCRGMFFSHMVAWTKRQQFWNVCVQLLFYGEMITFWRKKKGKLMKFPFIPFVLINSLQLLCSCTVELWMLNSPGHTDLCIFRTVLVVSPTIRHRAVCVRVSVSAQITPRISLIRPSQKTKMRRWCDHMLCARSLWALRHLQVQRAHGRTHSLQGSQKNPNSG